jgi:hypothetical protein
MPQKHVSWAELQQRCMHVAACVAATYKPGAVLICQVMFCLQGLRQGCCYHSMCAWLDSCKRNHATLPADQLGGAAAALHACCSMRCSQI